MMARLSWSRSGLRRVSSLPRKVSWSAGSAKRPPCEEITHGCSSTLEYNPMIETNGASSVKYTPGWVIVVRTMPGASGEGVGDLAQKLRRNACSVGATGADV